MGWTDEVVSSLRKMWAEGMTTGEIAKKLNVSKNSIIGKVHRLGLSGRPSPIKKKSDTKEKPIAVKETKPVKKEKAVKEPAKEAEPKAPAKVKVETKTPAPKKEKVVAKKAPEVKEIKKEKEPIKEIKKPETVYKKPKGGLIKVTDLDTHSCRWPVGDPKDEKFHFCGKTVRIGHTYCDEHSEIAYVKQTKR